MEDMDFERALQTLFSFVKVPTVFPYAIPGNKNSKVIRITIPFKNGEVGLPKMAPFSFFKKESAGKHARIMTPT